MDTIKKIIYEDNKQFLETIAKDLYGDSQEDINIFVNKYHKKNFSYMTPSTNDVKNLHKRRIKNAIK